MLIFGFWHSMAMLALEAGEVVRLRLARLAIGGDSGLQEMQLMFAEKVDAGFEAGANICAGSNPQSVVERYRQHVADNARRLTQL
jgi:hypothetical protein